MLKKLMNTMVMMMLAVSFLTVSKMALAEETTSDKVKDTAGDVKTKVKKTYRKVKREGRNAVGNDSVVKDVKDKINDTTDEIKNEAEKAKRKAK